MVKEELNQMLFNYRKLITKMEQTLGLESVIIQSEDIYTASRNRYDTIGEDVVLEEGVEAGLVERHVDSPDLCSYSITEEGIKYLGNILGIKIKL